MITVLGILQWKSDRHGGLYAAENVDDTPVAVTFLHNYFSTIIAVAYSVIWSWIDLDLNGLNPGFRCPKPAVPKQEIPHFSIAQSTSLPVCQSMLPNEVRTF